MAEADGTMAGGLVADGLRAIPADYRPYFSAGTSREYTAEAHGANWVCYGDSGPRPALSVNFNGTAGSRVIVGGSQAPFGASLSIHADNCTVILGDGLIGHAHIQLYAPAFIFVGSHTKLINTSIVSHQGAPVIVGNECQLAEGVALLAAEQHVIFDTRDFKPTSLCDEGIVIYPHVWIGQRTHVLKRAVIEAGSIIGAQSVVNGRIPKFSMAAGAPATVLKHNVSWDDPVSWVRDSTKAFVRRFS